MIDYMQKQTKLIEEAFNTDTRFTTARDKVIYYNFRNFLRLAWFQRTTVFLGIRDFSERYDRIREGVKMPGNHSKSYRWSVPKKGPVQEVLRRRNRKTTHWHSPDFEVCLG